MLLLVAFAYFWATSKHNSAYTVQSNMHTGKTYLASDIDLILKKFNGWTMIADSCMLYISSNRIAGAVFWIAFHGTNGMAWCMIYWSQYKQVYVKKDNYTTNMNSLIENIININLYQCVAILGLVNHILFIYHPLKSVGSTETLVETKMSKRSTTLFHTDTTANIFTFCNR